MKNKEEMETKVAENTQKVKLAPPWITYVNELIALFGGDSDIKTDYDEENKVFSMFVDGQIKADAIAKLLPAEKEFGAVKLKIKVIPSNEKETKETLFKNAFAGNPNFSYALTVADIFTNPVTYVVFKKLIVQFFNDDLSDVNGNCTTLLHEVAKDIFDEDGVFYCIDKE